MRILRLAKLNKTLNNLVGFGSKWFSAIQATRVFVFTLLVSHYIGCGWFVVASNENGWVRDGDNGLINACGDRDALMGKPGTMFEDIKPLEQYLCSMYWTLQTLTTIGYGDMAPVSNKERVYTTFIFTVGTCIFTVISGFVIGLVMSGQNAREEYRQKVIAMISYMRRRKINETLVDKTQTFYEHRWQSTQGIDDEEFFQDLPKTLRYEIFMDLNKRLLTAVPFFAPLMHRPEFLRRLVLIMTADSFLPGNTLVDEGDLGNEMFLIGRGDLSAISADKLVNITMTEGAFFGEMALSPIFPDNRKRSATITAITYCEVFTISRIDVAVMFGQFPELVEHLNSYVLSNFPHLLDGNMIDERTMKDELKIQALFSRFDRDGDGTIDVDELGTVMMELGQTLSDSELANMIKDVDIDGNGSIDFTEFMAMMVASDINVQEAAAHATDSEINRAEEDASATVRKLELKAMKSTDASQSVDGSNTPRSSQKLSGKAVDNLHHSLQMLTKRLETVELQQRLQSAEINGKLDAIVAQLRNA
eukprot:SAG11_NODE_703_length_7658_cov_12.066411_6_plen_533_part_00